VAAAVPIIAPAAFTGGDVSFGGSKATLLGTPTASTDAATKGYVDAKGPGIITGTGTAGRPVAPLAGQGYWRLDKNFLEVYDGTNWIVQGTVVVSSTADITTPQIGQQVINAGDEYRRWQYLGSGVGLGWQPINVSVATGQAIGGEWTNGSVQNFGANANALLFPTRDTAKAAGNGITVTNGGRDWTNEFEGLYFIDVQFRMSTVVASGVAMGLTPGSGGYSDATLLMAPKHPMQPTWGDTGLSGCIWLTAGTAWTFYFYNNTATATATTLTRLPRVRIWGMFAG
jgi:hypothetical protein